MQLKQNKAFLLHMEINPYYDNSRLCEYKAKNDEIILHRNNQKREFTAKKINPQKAVDACPDGND
jgi:hypothetical protein